MRRFLIATHTHLAQGFNEVVELLSGEHENVSVLNLYVDGNDDAEALLTAEIDSVDPHDELVICTDIMGGSVNNECLKLVQRRPNVFLLANTNLPLLLQLLFLPEGDTTEQIRGVVAAEETRVMFCNDLVAAEEEDEDDEF